MQNLSLDESHLPISGVCIISDPLRVPTGYQVISKSSDTNEDADLWTDRIFARKVTRYLCYTKRFPLDNGRLNNVVSDMSIINEKDAMPVGYSPLDLTIDSREKATNKKILCVRMTPRDSSKHGAVDIVLQKSSKRPPPGFTMIGEINGLNLCFKLGTVPDCPTNNAGSSHTSTAYASHYGAPPIPSRPAPTPFNPTTLQRHYSITSPLAGVPFEINSSLFNQSNGIYSNTLPQLTKKTLLDIEKEYCYNFRLELSNKERSPNGE